MRRGEEIETKREGNWFEESRSMRDGASQDFNKLLSLLYLDI